MKSDFIGPNSVSKRSAGTWEDICGQFFGAGSLDVETEGGEGGAKMEVEEDDDVWGVGGAQNVHPNAMVDDAREAADMRLREYKKEVLRREEIAKASLKGGGEGEDGKKGRRKKSSRGGDGEERTGERSRRK